MSLLAKFQVRVYDSRFSEPIYVFYFDSSESIKDFVINNNLIVSVYKFDSDSGEYVRLIGFSRVKFRSFDNE